MPVPLPTFHGLAYPLCTLTSHGTTLILSPVLPSAPHSNISGTVFDVAHVVHSQTSLLLQKPPLLPGSCWFLIGSIVCVNTCVNRMPCFREYDFFRCTKPSCKRS